MKPEDILDGLGQVSDRMVLDAQNLKKTPHRSLKWGSLAACILCGVVLLGVCAAKLWNRDDQQSLKPPETTIPTVASEPPQNSAEESVTESAMTVEPRAAEPGQVIVNDYQMVVRDDAIYFVDPYVGLMAMDPATKTTKTILGNGTCSLAESEGSLYCLDRTTRQVDLVENGDVTTLVTLEDVGPGYPFLLGVSDGYVCWRQNMNIYAASVEDGTTKTFSETDSGSGSILPCGVYQGGLYCVDLSYGALYRIDLSSGETEAMWEPEQGEMQAAKSMQEIAISADEWDSLLRLDTSSAMDGDRLYLEALQTVDAEQHYVYFCYDLTNGEMRELITLDGYAGMVEAQDGKLYLLHRVMQENGNQNMELLCCDGETGELSVVMDQDQLVEISNTGSCNVASVASNGLYYVRDSTAADPQSEGLFYYDLSAGTSTQVYRSDGIYGSLVMEPDFYWQSGDVYDVGAWYEHFNEVKDYYDLTYTEGGVYYANPSEGVYRYIPEEDRIEQVVSGTACRILKCDEGLYATCSDSGEVYEIQNGTAQLLLTLEKEQKIAVKPIAVKDGKLYWNYYVTDLSTGVTQTNALFRLKKSQPQIMHDGKIYCLGGNGQIGYVDPTGGTESYQPLTEALETNANDWAVKFFDDCIIALQKTEDGTGFDVFRVAYEDGSSKHLGTVTGETMNILNMDGDTLYLEPVQDEFANGIVALNITTGESQTIMEENPVLIGTEIQVWNGVCYSAYRELDVMEFGTYDLETGVETTYRADDSTVGE